MSSRVALSRERTAGLDVWRADLDDAGWPGEAMLPGDERRRAESIIEPRSRRRWVASRWTLRSALARYLGTDPADIALERSENGKPELADRSLRFNLSHSAGLALIAVAADREVGIDVERTDPRRDFRRLAERFLDPTVAELVRTSPSNRRADAFYRSWARHEARRKLAGCGPVASRADAAETVDLELGRGWAGAVAFSGRLPR